MDPRLTKQEYSNSSLGPRSTQGETTTHPRSTQQENSNTLLGPTSTQGETTNPFMTRPRVRLSPSVINNSATQGNIPPIHNE